MRTVWLWGEISVTQVLQPCYVWIVRHRELGSYYEFRESGPLAPNGCAHGGLADVPCGSWSINAARKSDSPIHPPNNFFHRGHSLERSARRFGRSAIIEDKDCPICRWRQHFAAAGFDSHFFTLSSRDSGNFWWKWARHSRTSKCDSSYQGLTLRRFHVFRHWSFWDWQRHPADRF